MICFKCKKNIDDDSHYCKYCGRSLKKGVLEYCSSECRKKGEIMWQEQARRKNLYQQNSIISVTRKLEEYNKTHNTNYTYGIFVGKILSKNKTEAKQ